MKRCSHIIAAALLGAFASQPMAAQSLNPKAVDAMAQLLVADELADICAQYVFRKNGKNSNDFIAKGVIQIINEEDLTMTDLVRVTEALPQEEMDRLKQEQVRRRGIELGNRTALCYFAQQIVGPDDEIGRFLERR